MGWRYYLSIFVDNYNSQIAYHNCQTNKDGYVACDDDLLLVRDINQCSPASDYLTPENTPILRP